MAEAIAFSIGEYILPKLKSIAANENGLMYNCRDELKKLDDTLSIIKDVILDAEELHEKSQFVRNRIKTLGEVLFDADDLLDEVTTEDLRQKLDTRGKMARQVWDFFSSSNHLAFRLKMGHAVNEIRDRLDLIASDISKFNFISKRVIVNTPIGGNRYRETESFVFELDVIGREEVKNEIIEMLIGPGSNTASPIIPIVGIGGLGKTTLAKLVFNDERVVKHFEPVSWVCVSENFNLNMIVRNILKSITDDKEELREIGVMEMEQLQSLLRRKLEGKRWLLVLDDVWNESRGRWKELERLLMIGASGCKIIVTTRSASVASAMDMNSPYVLEVLTDEESWKLFKQLSFGEGVEEVHPDIIEIGKELVDRCKGVPLAIKMLGSTMRSKTSLSEWLFMKNNETWLSSPNDRDILSVLKLSYDQLPTHLKNCFAYCSIFPKDYTIKYEVLIQLWMAQGYIQSSSSSVKSLESIGDQYFKDLLSKFFFQEVEFDDYRNITSVKMHDLIHDLAQQVLRMNYERVSHMSIRGDLKKLPSSLEEKCTRTFFLRDGLYHLKMGYFNQGTILSKHKYLRVLDLGNCGIKKVHDSIGSLKHLRYLNLSENKLIGLPDTISNLLNLQTLNLDRCHYLRRLPEVITKLSNLRYLVTDGCDQLTHMPAGMGNLTSLQKLSCIVIGEKKKEWGLSQLRCGLRDLKYLNDLRGQIRIRNLRGIGVEEAAEESKEANMKEKRYLQSLKLDWAYGVNTEIEQQAAELVLEGIQPHSDLKELFIEWYCGVRFPSWMMKMGNVVKISLEYCYSCQQLPSLDQLPFLKFLYIGNLENLEYIQEEGEAYNNNSNQVVTDSDGHPPLSSSSSSSSAFFPSLQQLQLRYMPKLKGWWRRRGLKSVSSSSEFPQLTKLSILKCPMLTSMPLHPNLEELHLNDVNGMLVREKFATTTTEEEDEEFATTTTATTYEEEEEEEFATASEGEEEEEEEEEEEFASTNVFNWVFERFRNLVRQILSSRTNSSSSSSSSSSLPKLKSLHIEFLRDWEAIPPEWLQNLTSLQSLTIHGCDQLAPLPCLASSLQLLNIHYSPILAERCQKESGQDWPNIAHIPNIIIFNQVIKGRNVQY